MYAPIDGEKLEIESKRPKFNDNGIDTVRKSKLERERGKHNGSQETSERERERERETREEGEREREGRRNFSVFSTMVERPINRSAAGRCGVTN